MKPLSSVLHVPLGPASGDDVPGAMTKKTNVFNRTRIWETLSPHSCAVLLHTDSTFLFFFFFLILQICRERICAFETSSSVSEPTRRCFQIISHTLWPELDKQNLRTRRKKVLLKNTSLHKINKNKKSYSRNKKFVKACSCCIYRSMPPHVFGVPQQIDFNTIPIYRSKTHKWDCCICC